MYNPKVDDIYNPTHLKLRIIYLKMPHLLGVREVIVDLLVEDVENHVQEIPAP